MNEIVINCAAIDSREALHRIFADALSFPEWYGRNLDALYDCLTGISVQTQVRLLDWEIAEARLGKYGLSAKNVIAKAAFQNPRLLVIL